jgi:hypothetical protein
MWFPETLILGYYHVSDEEEDTDATAMKSRRPCLATEAMNKSFRTPYTVSPWFRTSIFVANVSSGMYPGFQGFNIRNAAIIPYSVGI